MSGGAEQRRQDQTGFWFLPAPKSAYVLAILLVVSQLLFLIGIDRAAAPYFDEILYVPAARDLVSGAAFTTVEQPLIGKLLIGAGITLFGDNPLGWRIFSTMAGTATVAVIFLFMQLIFRDVRVSLAAGIFTVLNQMVFVQARIAMLDVFLGAFLLWGIYFFARSCTQGQSSAARADLLRAGAAFGLAAATKWAAIPYLLGALVIFCFKEALTRSVAGASAQGSSAKLCAWRGISAASGAACLGGGAVIIYFLSFIPATFADRNGLQLSALFSQQLEMYRLQSLPVAAHPYMSGPISWPFMTRPVWYLHEDVEGIRRAVLLIGNPVVMWAGLAATLFLFRSATLVKDPRMLIVPSLFLFALGMAVIFPGSISFYYHYYIAALFLPMGLATALETHFRRGRRRFVPLAALALTVATFVYFYPIISAAALPGPTAFEKWMWLSSWR